jgi:hypothetical protein
MNCSGIEAIVMSTPSMRFVEFSRFVSSSLISADCFVAVDAPVFFGIEVARVAGAAVSLLVPALRAGIDQRVMAMGAEVRRFGIGVLAFGADAGCKRWFGLIDVTGFICSAEFSN